MCKWCAIRENTEEIKVLNAQKIQRFGWENLVFLESIISTNIAVAVVFTESTKKQKTKKRKKKINMGEIAKMDDAKYFKLSPSRRSMAKPLLLKLLNLAGLSDILIYEREMSSVSAISSRMLLRESSERSERRWSANLFHERPFHFLLFCFSFFLVKLFFCYRLSPSGHPRPRLSRRDTMCNNNALRNSCPRIFLRRRWSLDRAWRFQQHLHCPR